MFISLNIKPIGYDLKSFHLFMIKLINIIILLNTENILSIQSL